MSDLGKRLLQSPLIARLGGFLIHTCLSRWMMTLNYRAAYHDPSTDAGRIEYSEPVIYLIWHEYLTLPFFVRHHTKLTLLASRHRDAEVLAQAANLAGFKVYRGSSGRGGVAVLREILRDRSMRGLVITPDGPRGPRRKVASGAMFLASRLQMPIVLLGAGLQNPIRIRQVWDQHAVPRLHSRARLIASRKIYLRPDLDRDELKIETAKIEHALNLYTIAAENWASSNRPMQNETAFYPGPFNCDSRLFYHSQD